MTASGEQSCKDDDPQYYHYEGSDLLGAGVMPKKCAGGM